MRDFNNFTPTDNQKVKRSNYGKNVKSSNDSQNGVLSGDILKQFASIASAYEGKSSDDMMKAIIAEAQRAKKNGTLSNGDIDAFVSTVSPLVNQKQRQMLVKVAEKIKKI